MNDHRQSNEPDGNAASAPQVATQFDVVAPLYDELMTGVPYDKWIGYLQKLLALSNLTPRRILDLACGTGNVSELLAEEGYHSIVGVDIAPAMIAEARAKASQRSLNIDYRVQDAAELDIPGPPFDLCISLFDSLNYVLQPERLQMAFHRVAAHLSRNGLFIFDLNTEYALINGFFTQDNQGTPAALQYRWQSTFDRGARICTVNMSFEHRPLGGPQRSFKEVHQQFAYRKDEILDMLDLAGFSKVDVYQAYTLRPSSRTSDRLFYVAVKP